MDHLMYRKAMSRLRAAIAILTVCQLSLIARVVIEGVSVAAVVAEALIGLSSSVVVTLWRQGRRRQRGRREG
jgi:hypothetical protein